MEENVEIKAESALDKLNRMQNEYIDLENEYEVQKEILEKKQLELGNQENDQEIAE